MANVKKLPIGIEYFDEIITEGFYYVDKTGLIKELLDNWSKVNLITRPRRCSIFKNQIYTWFGNHARKDTSRLDTFCEAHRSKVCRK